MTRRDLLGGAAIAALASCNSTTKTAAPAPATESAGKPFHLEPAWLETTYGDTPVRVRAYNGQVPGPLMTVEPGKTFHVHLKNSLVNRGGGPPSPHVHDIDVPHDFEATNLHLHGLDTPPHLFNPLGTSDPKATMISIKPAGGEFDYHFEIPPDHPPGLYWYHPHQHGSTAVQAVSGMAGPLIIKGPIDEVPEIKAARDILMAVQDIGLFQSDEPNDTRWTYNPRPRMIWQTFGGVVQYWDKTKKAFVNSDPPLHGGYTTGDYALRYFLMNGKPFYKETHNNTPPPPPNAPKDNKGPTWPIGQQMDVQTITLAQGEVVRIRMLNGCSDNYMPIRVEGQTMHVLAFDGVNFDAPRPLATVALAPANRVEFLLQAPNLAGATFNLVQDEQSEQFLHSDRKTIAKFVVSDEKKPMALPAKLPVPTRYYPLLPEPKSKPREIRFTTQFRGPLNPEVGMDFKLNGAVYAEQIPGIVVELGAEETWNLVLPKGESEGHPFHIHVNHFEVISVNGVEQPRGILKDTIWIPKPSKTQDSVVVVRMKFKQFTGKAVFHCHILPHEDTGMMSNFTILGPVNKAK